MTDFIFEKLSKTANLPEYRWSMLLSPPQKTDAQPKASAKTSKSTEKKTSAKKPAESKSKTKKANSAE